MRKNLSTVGVPDLRFGLLCALSALALSASAAGDKLGAAPVKPAQATAPSEPVSRFIIRYKSGVKLGGQSGTSPVTERQQAVDQVARSASIAGMGQLQYLKSVSPQLHVAHLDQAVSSAEAQQLMQRLRADAAVEDVVIDRRVKPHATPNDPFLVLSSPNNQWHLQDSSAVRGGINVRSVWDANITGAGVVVAVLDSGYRPHADLAANVLQPGYDFISADTASNFGGQAFWTANDGDARDGSALDPGDGVTAADVTAGYCSTADTSSWHGSHVAGLVSAVGNNAEGGLGVAFGANVLPVRVLGRCGGYSSDIIAGARWAAGLSGTGALTNPPSQAKVLNLSLGLQGACDSVTQSVVDEIRAHHVSIVASAGNEGMTSISAPGNCSGVMAVTAHTRDGDNADYANVGPGTAISAPGGGDNAVLFPGGGFPRGISSTTNSGTAGPVADNYRAYQGTSMAAPQMAGVLALLASARPGVFAMATLESLIRGAAREFPAGSYCVTNPNGLAPGFCGGGMLDAQAALTALNAAPAASGDLEVSYRMPSGVVESGQTVTFPVRVVNWGPLDSLDVRLIQSVSPGLQVQSVTANSGAVVSFNVGGITATLPNLAAGSAVTLNVTVLVTADSGRVSSSAAVSSAAVVDPTPVNNSDQQVNTVVAPPVVVPPVVAQPVVPDSGGGGGCTMAPDGQADAGLVLVALAAALVLIGRRRPGR